MNDLCITLGATRMNRKPFVTGIILREGDEFLEGVLYHISTLTRGPISRELGVVNWKY
jgi:hypothetical protein